MITLLVYGLLATAVIALAAFLGLVIVAACFVSGTISQAEEQTEFVEGRKGSE